MEEVLEDRVFLDYHIASTTLDGTWSVLSGREAEKVCNNTEVRILATTYLFFSVFDITCATSALPGIEFGNRQMTVCGVEVAMTGTNDRVLVARCAIANWRVLPLIVWAASPIVAAHWAVARRPNLRLKPGSAQRWRSSGEVGSVSLSHGWSEQRSAP